MDRWGDLQAHLLASRASIEAALGISDASCVHTPAALLKHSEKAKRAVESNDLPLRRSSRVAGLPTVDYLEGGSALSTHDAAAPRPKRLHADELAGEGEGDDDEDAPRGARAPSASAAHAGSLKYLDARPQYMHDTYLGSYVPFSLGGPGFQAKRAVICAANASSITARMSAMGGIKEFRNAMLLFVNISPGCTNKFTAGGQTMTWFAQNKQTLDSAQVQRLIRHRSGSASVQPCEVCLVCRLDPAQPYIWCGTLEYISHDPATHPVKFVWRLAHAARLTGSEAAAAGSSAAVSTGSALFRAILEAAG